MALVHTCIRVFDLDRSIPFYEALGFTEVKRESIRDEAINVHLGLEEDGAEPSLELTFNHGQAEPYDIGTGYGHIALTAPDLERTLARLAEQGIEPEREPYSATPGGTRICFVRDPDGYRIELLGRNVRV